MKLHIFQKGFNFSQDGPGNRLVYHLSGCGLRCPWCSNPEGLSPDSGIAYTVQELTDEAVSARPMFFSGGGVTLTGGEVTGQFAGVKALLEALKAHHIHTCIETNGTHPRLPELSHLVDHLIMDIKHYDDAAHRQVIGASNSAILQNIRTLSAQRSVHLRIPLIGGFNASKEDARAFAAFLAPLPNITLELLRYHEYGKDKYAQLGLPYTMTANARVSDEAYNTFSKILTDAHIPVVRT